ncbi:hypothetical protein B296_00019233 [Ensete ventricosum]|uniref:Uncharacterized protein n=1 Tax=Ensete ventricosum TaxID=4639 RepID=A0A427B0K3_ENSVE|nr:hypothetical protein B296_00019233 [Ensete ventricosum]
MNPTKPSRRSYPPCRKHRCAVYSDWMCSTTIERSNPVGLTGDVDYVLPHRSARCFPSLRRAHARVSSRGPPTAARLTAASSALTSVARDSRRLLVSPRLLLQSVAALTAILAARAAACGQRGSPHRCLTVDPHRTLQPQSPRAARAT